MDCAQLSPPPILAAPARLASLAFRPGAPRSIAWDASVTASFEAAIAALPLDQLAARARAGDDACRFELLARWCADPRAEAGLGDRVWEQYRRLLYRWILAYVAQRGLSTTLLTEADETLDDAVDSLAAQVLMRFFERQAGADLAARFPSMGHVNRYLTRVTWSIVGEHLRRQLALHRHRSRWPEGIEGDAGEVDALDLPMQVADAHGDLGIDPGLAVDAQLGRARLWQGLRGHCKSDAEWVVLLERFAHERPPREIMRRHPEHFASIDQLYRTLERVMVRLRKDDALSAAGREALA